MPELIRSLATAEKEGDRLVVNGREIRSVAMIHCVGSRQIPGIHPEDESGRLNEYCSRTCCSATLNAANTIREAYPGTSVYEFYRDIRTYGRGQEELYDQASRNRVVFLRFEAEESPQVVDNSASGDFPLRVKVKDTLTFGEEVDVPADLVVLATGMEPTGISELVEMMKLPVGTDRFLSGSPSQTAAGRTAPGRYLAGRYLSGAHGCRRGLQRSRWCGGEGRSAARSWLCRTRSVRGGSGS